MNGEQTTPPALVMELAALCSGLGQLRNRRQAGQFLRGKLSAQQRRFRIGMAEPGPDGVYRRPPGPLLRVDGDYPLLVELGKVSVTRAALRRFEGEQEGWRVLVLMWARQVEPWRKQRSEWHRIDIADLDGVDYVIAARTKPIVRTREQIKQAWRDALEQEQREKQREKAEQEQRRTELKQRVLALVEQAWNNKEPVSEHGRTEKQRNLIYLLSGEATAQETKAAVKQLLEAGSIERAHHRYSGLKGLKHTRQNV